MRALLSKRGRLAGVLAGAALASGCARAADDLPRTTLATRSSTVGASTPRVTPSPAGRPARLAAATPTTTTAVRPGPCAHNARRQLVLVSVQQQHVWMCAGHRQVHDSPVTTGAVDLPYRATPTGTFRVQSKQTRQVLTLVSGAQYTVKYWIPFDAPLFGFHDSPWQTMPYGSPRYRTNGSHGCVHVPLAAMRFLYGWADVGATVRITA